MAANLQEGDDGAAVYTTKIMLALNRVSKLQWQPFMVRLTINIAGGKASEAGGGRRCMSTSLVHNTFMGAARPRLVRTPARHKQPQNGCLY